MNYNKRGNIIGNWLDYLLIFVIALFGFIFLWTSLSFSLLARDNLAVTTTDSLILAQNLIHQQGAIFFSGDKVEIESLKNEVAYVNTYFQLPPPKGDRYAEK